MAALASSTLAAAKVARRDQYNIRPAIRIWRLMERKGRHPGGWDNAEWARRRNIQDGEKREPGVGQSRRRRKKSSATHSIHSIYHSFMSTNKLQFVLGSDPLEML